MSHASEQSHLKLPLWKSVYDTYALTLSHFGKLVRIGWVWVALFTAFIALFYWYDWPSEQAARAIGDPRILYTYVPYIVSIAVGSSIAIGWHRYLLLGERQVTRAYLRVDRTVFRYFLYSIVLTILMLGPLTLPLVLVELVSEPIAMDMPVASEGSGAEASATQSDAKDADGDLSTPLFLGFVVLASPVIFFVFAIPAYLPTRLALVLPAIAIGNTRFGPRESWRLSSGNFWRLYAGSAMAIAPPLVIEGALCYPSGLFDHLAWTQWSYVLDSCITELIGFMAGLTGITFLSVAYRYFMGIDTVRTAGSDSRSEAARTQ